MRDDPGIDCIGEIARNVRSSPLLDNPTRYIAQYFQQMPRQRKDAMYEEQRYRIGEFSAMTGMTPSRVRFYERQGLFPQHRTENGYRYYTPNDAFRYNAFRTLVQYGFTIEQAVKMLDARQDCDDFGQSLLEQRDRLLREIDLLEYRIDRIDAAISFIDSAHGGDFEHQFEVVDVQDQLYVRASRGADFDVSTRNKDDIAFFYDRFGVTGCARIIDHLDFANDAPTVDPTYINVMPACEQWRLTGHDLEHVHRLNMGKCLRFRRQLTREESVRKETFDEMFSYLASHGYRLRGDILLLPAFLNLDGRGTDIETLLAPID